MSVLIDQTAPNFEADTTQGRINFHDWIGDSWAVLFSHPKDYTQIFGDWKEPKPYIRIVPQPT
ncbi:MAG: hypothetical protein ACRDPG_01515 [Nocardioidaceae bacterium]